MIKSLLVLGLSDRVARRAGVLGSLVVAAMAVGMAHAQATYSDTRTSRFSYYVAADGAKRGLLKSETIEPDSPQLCVSTTYDYDAYGNKVSATTANCSGASGRALFDQRSSSSVYAAVASQTITVGASSATVNVLAGLFATSSSNALSHSESKTYDPRFGAALSLTGPNQLTTAWKLDDFGRITREQRADGTKTLTAYCTLASSGLDTTANSNTTNGDPLSCPTSPAGEAPNDAVMFVHSVPQNSTGTAIGPFVRVYKDRLGRELRSVTESFDGTAQASGRSGVAIYKDTVYNANGVKELETQAYFAVNGSSTATGNNDVGVVKTVVDVLGRPTDIYVADPSGQAGSQAVGAYGSRVMAKTTIAYAGLTITTTNDKGQARVESKNALGELVRVIDATGATLIHQRDAFGNLIKTKDALGNVTTVVYDTRGRKTRLEDPDTGIWKYDYDALGQLVWQQSPNQLALNTETTMVYDRLGRMTSRTEPEYTSTWKYDANADGTSCMNNGNANQGKGKLCQTSSSNGLTRQYAYDNLGRPKSSRTNVNNGPSFASAVSYDAVGRVNSQTYPSGLSVGYAYTTLGFLEKLVLNTTATVAPLPNAGGQTAAGSTLNAGTVLWQAKVVGAWGKVEQQLYGNGITSNAAFQAGTGRVTGLTAGASNSVLSQTYAWDSLNNLSSRSDSNGDGIAGGVTESFSYGDQLNRLTGYTVSAPAIPGMSRTVNLHYNALGMLLYKSDVGNYSYGAQGGAAGSKPHALQGVAGPFSAGYTYDANGNLSTATAGKYRTLSYTSFNLPDNAAGLQGPAGTPKYGWLYDENHARIQETRQDASGTRTTWNLHPDNQGGLGFEREIAPGGAVSNRHYLSAGGQAIGVLISTGALATLTTGQTEPAALASIVLVKVEYWHKDHLGSLITTTDHQGSVTQRYAYDPFGKRRYTNGSYDEFGNVVVDWSSTRDAGTDRGYTGHEHLDDVGIVHMNGRLFDPTLGVVLQGDPLIQDPSNLQNYNRYGYCYNNPLSCTDPSGYSWLSKTWHKIWRNKIIRTAIVVVAAYYAGTWAIEQFATNTAATAGYSASASAVAAGETAQTAFMAFEHAYASAYAAASSSITGGMIGGTAGGFTGAFVASSGNLEAGLEGAFNGAIGGGISNFYGAQYPATRIVANGMAGGMGSVLRGGRFADGFRSSAIISSLAYLNWQMRQSMIEQSRIDGNNDGTGWSRGMFGDGFKLGGGRWFDGANPEKCSELGCWQNGAGSVFGRPYASGGLQDMVVESFAGPHDMANSPWWYVNGPKQVLEDLGMIGDALPSKYYSPFAYSLLEATTNYTTSLMFAAPFAAGAMLEQSWVNSNTDAMRRRR